MKRFFYIAVLSLFSTICYSQTGGKQLEVTSKTGSKLQFSEIKIEGSEATNSFKTLILKYKKLPDPAATSITEGGVTYKCFADKKSAVSSYYKVKSSSPKKVTYYVHSEVTKKPEILTFRSAN